MDDIINQLGPIVMESFQHERTATQATLRRTVNPVALASQLHRNSDSEASEIRKQVETSQERKLACGKGCMWCCYQPVDASANEVIAIGHLISKWSITERDAFWERVESYADKIAELPRGSRHAVVRANLPCPAIGREGECSVYSARPNVCRGVDSFDASVCEAAIGDPLLVGPSTMATHVVSGRLIGHRDALSRRGYDGDVYDFAAALAELHDMGTEEVLRRWLAKEKVFSENAAPQISESETAEISSQWSFGRTE
jgi:Fe-S-cluster containining protein